MRIPSQSLFVDENGQEADYIAAPELAVLAGSIIEEGSALAA